MSEGFDKEAERERLREQYEADQADREATQRMSELLLQGATMTNQHCDECGDPIFRWDGTEFCPTCEREVDTSDDTETDEADAETGTEEDEVVDARATHPSIDAADVAAQAAEGTTEEDDAPDEPAAPDAQSTEQATSTAAGTPSGDVAAPAASATADAATQRAPPADAGDLDEARASLVRTLTALARRAEATDDAGHARELLAGAREAAEAIAAVDEVRR